MNDMLDGSADAVVSSSRHSVHDLQLMYSKLRTQGLNCYNLESPYPCQHLMCRQHLVSDSWCKDKAQPSPSYPPEIEVSRWGQHVVSQYSRLLIVMN